MVGKSLPKAAVLYIAFVLLMIVVICLKSNYYIDEIYSYGLSNHTGEGINITFEYDKTYTPGASVFRDYMEVQSGEQFDYSCVWANQTDDVHPPFYYAILHTICSVFPDTFSKWYAGSINIVFAILVLFVMRKQIQLLTDNKYILTIMSVSFVLLSGILHAVAYFRMYIMAMLWVTLLSYLFVKQVDEKHDFRFYRCLYLVTAAGALTHYYVIIFAFFISCMYGVYLLWEKRIKEVLFFCLTMALAAGTSIVVFPAMIQHMFYEYRGVEAIGNLAAARYDNYWDALKAFFTVLNQQVFGGMLGHIIISFLILSAVIYFRDERNAGEEWMSVRDIFLRYDRKCVKRYVLLVIPCFLYFMLVSKMSFVVADRYISPIYAVSYVCIMCMIFTVLNGFLKGNAFIVLTVSISALLIVGSYVSAGWTYLFWDSRAFLAAAEEHGNYDCICVFEGENWLLHPEFAEYSVYKSVTFISPDELREEGIAKWDSGEGVIVSFIGNSYNLDERVQELVWNNGYGGYIYLGTFGFDNSYFLHK